MSSVAFAVGTDAMILLSDGLAIDVGDLQPGPDMVIPEDRIVSRNYRKAWKLSESIGVLWTGGLHGFMDKYKDVFDTTSPEAAARHLTRGIKECIVNSGYSPLMSKPWFNVNVHLLGYAGGQPAYWHIVKRNERIVLDEPKTLPPGAAACKAPYVNLDDQFRTYLDPSDPIGSGRDAFIATLDAQSDNMPLGGTIFSEVISP